MTDKKPDSNPIVLDDYFAGGSVNVMIYKNGYISIGDEELTLVEFERITEAHRAVMSVVSKLEEAE
jgi:hypothetical protein